MPRTIKFRAWVKSKDSMVDVIAIEQTPDEEYPHGWIACPWEQGFNESIDTQEKDCVFKTEDVVLMQYTGLKDKNGKEIYEGDIVKYDHCSRGFLAEVVYNTDEGSYGVKDGIDFWGIGIVGGPSRGVEIKGNIYENPELLLSKEAREQGEWEAQAEAESHYEPEEGI